jgi:putative ABC transport system permease protein
VSAQDIPRIEEAGISGPVLAVTAAMTVLTGILFGFIPALRAYWIGLKGGMTEGQKGSVGSANRRMNSTLVAVQLALSLMLLIGAGLMLKSFRHLTTIDPGFETEKVLSMILTVSSKRYESPQQALGFYRRVLEDVRGLPGVRDAAITSNIPMSGRGAYDGHVVEGKEPQGDEAPQAEIKVISPGYFRAMGIPLRQGRDFLESDNGDEEAPLVAIVDEKLARQYWPDGDALGKRIRTLDPEWYTIVGVVPTVKGQSLAEESYPHLYLPFQQLFFAYGQGGNERRMYLVANSDNPDALASAIRERVRALDPDVPIHAVSTMSGVINKRLDSQRLINVLLMAFSVIALFLAAIGTYGVMSVFVNSRASEFAIRLALGAQPRSLRLSVLKQGLVLAAAGVVFGLLGAWALTRAISSQLFEVSTTDPLIFTLTPLTLVAVALLACYLPAHRAARTDPASVLRNL